MRKLRIKTWKQRGWKIEEGKVVGNEEIEWNLLKSINILLSQKDPKDMPKGLDNFRLMNRIGKAFDKAYENGILQLEETDYKFLKDTITSDVPANWGINEKLCDAFESFLNAEQE